MRPVQGPHRPRCRKTRCRARERVDACLRRRFAVWLTTDHLHAPRSTTCRQHVRALADTQLGSATSRWPTHRSRWPGQQTLHVEDSRWCPHRHLHAARQASTANHRPSGSTVCEPAYMAQRSSYSQRLAPWLHRRALLLLPAQTAQGYERFPSCVRVRWSPVSCASQWPLLALRARQPCDDRATVCAGHIIGGWPELVSL